MLCCDAVNGVSLNLAATANGVGTPRLMSIGNGTVFGSIVLAAGSNLTSNATVPGSGILSITGTTGVSLSYLSTTNGIRVNTAGQLKLGGGGTSIGVAPNTLIYGNGLLNLLNGCTIFGPSVGRLQADYIRTFFPPPLPPPPSSPVASSHV